MTKGVAVNFQSYTETIPKVLRLIKFDVELKKHDKIVIKPHLLAGMPEKSTKAEFVESIVQFCIANKNPASEIIIAEGVDGAETMDVFDQMGYTKLAEKYGIGLADLNEAASVEVQNPEFLRFSSIHYPEMLLNSFVMTATPLLPNQEIGMTSSLDSMVGAFPAYKYRGFFSSTKNKLKSHPTKYQIHDILKCKMPEFAMIDASDKSLIIVGRPLEMDKQAAKVLGLDWRQVSHLRLIDESFSTAKKEEGVDQLIGTTPENK